VNTGDFTLASPGRLVPTPLGVAGFVPNPLPPKFSLDAEAVRLLAKAQLALGELRGVGTVVPNPELVAGPLLSREARYSSEIEGTFASAEDMAIAGADPKARSGRPDTLEVLRYRGALEAGLRRLQTDKPSLDLLRKAHRDLFAISREPWKTPGEFRIIQNRIADSKDDPPEKARFVPPPPGEVQNSLDELMSYVSRSDDHPPLVRIALVHYQFETIHPFIDGNGRVGRLLIVLLLSHWKLLEHPMLQLSHYLSVNKAEYVDRLLAVSQRGEWLAWIKFFLAAVATQAADSVQRSTKLWALREDFRKRVQAAGGSTRLVQLVDELFVQQALTGPWVAWKLGVSPPTGYSYLDRLEKLGIVRKIAWHAGRYKFIYLAGEVVDMGK
jgi:Fic family protein